MTLATIAPFGIDFGSAGSWLIYILIGVGFGVSLEMAGFAYSPNLAAQFYGKDMRVLKTMFTAIVTAMVLIFLSSSIGVLDYRALSVNTTYLWPGIVGGFIMGLGFVTGGYCPGTALAGAATGAKDAWAYIGGLLIGIFAFGETVDSFVEFWVGWDMGRYTLPEMLGVSTGAVVLGVVVMALLVFWWAERTEQRLGGLVPRTKPGFAAAFITGTLVLGLAVFFAGQPGWEDHWADISDEKQAELDQRLVQIQPGELLNLIYGDRINLVMLDVRPEAAYNLYHIKWADRVDPNPDALLSLIPDLKEEPARTVVATMSDDETAATEAWKLLTAEQVANVYILEGGVNKWLETFGEPAALPVSSNGTDQLRFVFASALGDRYESAHPDPEVWELEFEKKVKVEASAGPEGGGCG